jgi:hypothetical protein
MEPAWVDSCAQRCRQIVWKLTENIALPITEINSVHASKSHGNRSILAAGLDAEGMPDLKRFHSPELQFKHCLLHAFGNLSYSQHFVKLKWSRMVSWQNSDGSHHLARAIWLAHTYGFRQTIRGVCTTWGINQEILKKTELDFGLFVLPSRLIHRISADRYALIPRLAYASWKSVTDDCIETSLIARDPMSSQCQTFDLWIADLIRQGIARTLTAELEFSNRPVDRGHEKHPQSAEISGSALFAR